jgi:hypothetical protein
MGSTQTVNWESADEQSMCRRFPDERAACHLGEACLTDEVHVYHGSYTTLAEAQVGWPRYRIWKEHVDPSGERCGP